MNRSRWLLLLMLLDGSRLYGTPGLYGRPVEPSEYPAYQRRGFLVPTWKTFGDRPQAVGGRYLRFTDPVPEMQLTEGPDTNAVLSGREWLVGRVFQPNIGILRTPEPEFSDALRRMRDTGMYLFNVGGYGPGAAFSGGYGQVLVTEVQEKALTEILGERWLGFDLGEQDGRYHNVFESRQMPAPRDRVAAHRYFRDWCDRVVSDQGGRISLLTVLWGWHYPAQDGAMTLLGAESESKFGVASPQVQYAFLRGAGKQYGILWFGNVALFNAFGVQYWVLQEDGTLAVEGRGSSLNLMRRLYLSQWLWNSCILSFENATLARSRDRKRAKVSPIGQVQMDTERLIQNGFTPGVMQTPVALLQDYFSGWMPPRTNTAQFQSMNSMSYTSGDYLTDALLSLLFPGYENSGWFFDESGTLCPTPYGDIADCLLNDAPAEILSRYSLLLVSGIEHDVAGTRDRLDQYCASGGTVMATGDDAARLWPEYCDAGTVAVPAGVEVQWCDGATNSHETVAFDLHEARLPANATVLASCEGRPALVRIPHKGGSLVLALSSTGMNRVGIPCQPSRNVYSQKGENTGLERPFRLLNHVVREYDAVLASQRLFTSASGLTLTTCRRSDGSFVVGVSNPGLRSLPFEIESHIGPVAAIKEVDLGTPMYNQPGYWPVKYGPYNPRAKQRDVLEEFPGEASPSDSNHIRGGDIRFFEVKLKTCSAQERPHLKPPSPPCGRFLHVPDLITLRERLLSWPRFGYFFDGVTVDAQAVCDTDPQWLKDHAEWFRRHGLRILVDARGIGGDAFTKAIERLACYGRGAEVLADKLLELRQREAACQTGLVFRTPEQIRWFKAGTAPARGSEAIQILEGDLRSWDALYRDVRTAWFDPVPGTIAGPGQAVEQPKRKAKAGLNRSLALRGIRSLATAVAERPGLLDRFDGLVLEAAWLEGRSSEAVVRDRVWLEAHGLGVVIDFSGLINRFPDLSFSQRIPHIEQESVRRLDALIFKMALLGSHDAIMCTMDRTVDGRDDQLPGVERFLTKAEAQGVTVHWRPCVRRFPGTLSSHAALVAELQHTHRNLRMAACTVEEPDVERLTRVLAPAGKSELWLVAAPYQGTERVGDRLLPLTTVPREKVTSWIAAGKGSKMVFDADYLTWDETLADVAHVQ